MSDYSDRLDRIREGRDKCRTYNTQKGIPNDSLPQMHKDLHWLLEIVDAHNELIQENKAFETAAKIKMEHIMGQGNAVP